LRQGSKEDFLPFLLGPLIEGRRDLETSVSTSSREEKMDL
jgi:hypothetical protein